MKKQVSNFSKVLSLIVVLCLMVPAMSQAQAGKTNFSGNWVFNAEKSTQPQGGQGGGQRMGGAGGNFVAKQEANLLTVERTRTNQDGQATTTVMKYTLDGKESINTNPRGDTKSVATWSADGKILTIVSTRTFDMNGESRTMKTTEVYTLSGNTLTVKSTRPGQDGDVVATLVYDKK
jgi:Tol biopolymer transport system component